MTQRIIGFTGTRSVRLVASKRTVIVDAIGHLPLDTVIITGGCIGLDAFVAEVAHKLSYHVHTIIPADRSRVDPDWREHCTTYTEMPEGTHYKARNQEIVNVSHEVVAFPAYPEDHPKSTRSGTWQTIRLAQHANKPVTITILSEVPE